MCDKQYLVITICTDKSCVCVHRQRKLLVVTGLDLVADDGSP